MFISTHCLIQWISPLNVMSNEAVAILAFPCCDDDIKLSTLSMRS